MGSLDVAPCSCPFPIRWRFRQGTACSPRAYLRMLRVEDCRLSRGQAGNRRAKGLGRDLLKYAGSTPGPRHKLLELVDVSGEDLELGSLASYDLVCSRLPHFGLAPCPAEAGGLLAVLYRDQPPGEVLTVLTAPLKVFRFPWELLFRLSHHPRRGQEVNVTLAGRCFRPKERLVCMRVPPPLPAPEPSPFSALRTLRARLCGDLFDLSLLHRGTMF